MRITNLEKKVGNFKLKIDDLLLKPEIIHGIVGPNGCWKTVFLKILAGILKPDAGEIDYDGLSGRDMIAVNAKRTIGASESEPLTLRQGVDYQIVDTGDPVHDPYDAVIMAEDVLELCEGRVQIIATAPGWQHIRPLGEDIVAGEMLLSGGITRLSVFQKPVVGIIPTGTEMIEPSDITEEGDIIESNSRMFEAMVTVYGGVSKRYAAVTDDYEKIKTAIKAALTENDIVIVNAGSSAGTEDYTVHVLRELGEVLVHGVAMKPGKLCIPVSSIMPAKRERQYCRNDWFHHSSIRNMSG